MPEAAAPPYPSHPVMDKGQAILVLIFNLFVPGSGTVASAIFVDRQVLAIGIIQMLLALLIVTFPIAWVWALVSSIFMVANASWSQHNTPQPGTAAE